MARPRKGPHAHPAVTGLETGAILRASQGATEAPCTPWRASASAMKPLAFMSAT